MGDGILSVTVVGVELGATMGDDLWGSSEHGSTISEEHSAGEPSSVVGEPSIILS